VETFLKESFHTFKELSKKKFENSRYGYIKTIFRKLLRSFSRKATRVPASPTICNLSASNFYIAKHC
jgi:secreted Zn-dependent insulinase-like peptidase